MEKDGTCDCRRLLSPLKPGDSLPDHVCDRTAEETVIRWAFSDPQYAPVVSLWPYPASPRTLDQWNEHTFPAMKRPTNWPPGTTTHRFPSPAPGIAWLTLVVTVDGPGWRLRLYGSATNAPRGPEQARAYGWESAQPLHVELSRFDDRRKPSTQLRALLGSDEIERLNTLLSHVTSPTLTEPVALFDRVLAGSIGMSGPWTLGKATVNGLIFTVGGSFQAWQYGECIQQFGIGEGRRTLPAAASHEAERITTWYVRTVLRQRVHEKPGRKPGQAKALRHLSADDIADAYALLADDYMTEGLKPPRRPDLGAHFGVHESTLKRRKDQLGLTWPPVRSSR